MPDGPQPPFAATDPIRRSRRIEGMSARALLVMSTAVVIVAALPAATAAGDGLPGQGVAANPVSAPGGDVEYVATSARHHTVLGKRALGGRSLRQLRLRGTFTVPAVAYDGSPSGLSADGRTLVLIKPRTSWPRERTTFAVIDAKSMQVRRRFTLPGDFSFDAISPNGRVAYLIQYLSPRDVTKYAVRAYDMRGQRLFRAPVVDKSEPDEDMSGIPLARVSDSQGRWAYTLYDGAEHPFVHALDTEHRTAVCIDLDDVRSLRGAGLELSGDRLTVSSAVMDFAVIDTTTHSVLGQRRPKRAAEAPPEYSAGTPWLLIAAPTAGLLLLAAVGRRRLNRGRAQARR
jgi:hypothetical protein